MEDQLRVFLCFSFISPTMEMSKTRVKISPSMEITKKQKREEVSQFQNSRGIFARSKDPKTFCPMLKRELELKPKPSFRILG